MAFGYSAISKKCAGTAIPYTTLLLCSDTQNESHIRMIRYPREGDLW